MKNKQSPQYIFDKYAVGYQDKYMDVDLYNETFDLFCSSIKHTKPNILEVGCGPGNITRYLLAKRNDFKIFGIDVAAKMVELAKTNNPTAQFEVMDCKNISKLEKHYDGIMSGFCLPYLSENETNQFIKDSSALLNTNGILYISTMESKSNKQDLVTSSSSNSDSLKTYYHSNKFLTQKLKENNFKIIELQTINNPQYIDDTINDIVIIAKKLHEK